MQLDLHTAIAEGEKGLTRAVEKADRDYKDWSDRCWHWFLIWLAKKPTGFHFQIEDYRIVVLTWKKIEEPPSNRAFGFISKRAVKQELIVSVGKAKTKSKTGHGCNSEVWMKI